AREVATDLMQADGAESLLIAPEADRGVVAAEPLRIRLVNEDGSVKRMSPRHLHAEHVRMAAGDAEDGAEFASPLDGGVVEVADGVPEERSLVGCDDLHAVSDPDMRIGRDDESSGLALGPAEPLPVVFELFESRPA